MLVHGEPTPLGERGLKPLLMPEPSPKSGAMQVGLCLTCRHSKRIETPRSRFWMCGLAAIDPRFVKYPRLPVVVCIGYERIEEDDPAR